MSSFKEMLTYIQGPLDPIKFVIGCILLTVFIFGFYYCCCKSDNPERSAEDADAISSSNAVLLNSANVENGTSPTKDTIMPSIIDLRVEYMANVFFKTLTKHYPRPQSQPSHRTGPEEYRIAETV